MGRIIFSITDLSKKGGAEKQALSFAQCLYDRGCEISLYSQQVNQELIAKFAPKVHVIRSLIELIRYSKKDSIVISFLAKDHLLGILFRLFGFKWVPFERVHPEYYEKFSSRRKLIRLSKLFVRSCLQNHLASGLLVQCNSAGVVWRNRYGYKGQYRVVPNVYALNRQKNTHSSGELSSKVKVAFVGRLIPFKDPKLSLLAFLQARARLEELELHIFGRGQEEEGMRMLLLSSEFSSSVFFHGFIPQIEKHLMECDIFIMTSHVEGMPNSLGEAMAIGLPCVVTSFPGGSRELLGESFEEHSGQIVYDRDPQSIAEVIVRLARNPKLREDLGKSNRERIKNLFNEQRAVDLLKSAVEGFQTGIGKN